MTSAPLDDTDALIEIFNTADSGPSPYGTSHHEAWISCGKREMLRLAEKAVAAENEDQEDGSDPNTVYPLKVGIYGHKLWEGRIKRQLGTDLLWDARASTFNASFRQAVEMYKDYHKHWGSVEERFGCHVLGAEISLGGLSRRPALMDPEVWRTMSAREVAKMVHNRLGGPFTGRADAIIEVLDPDKAKYNTGLSLMPGPYIYDLKSGKKHGSDDEALYADGLQSKGYLWLHALEHGENSALGFIADRVIWGHAVTDKVKSYRAYCSYPDIFAEERLRAMIRLSNRSKADPAPNPLACKGNFGRQCWYRTNGTCQGY